MFEWLIPTLVFFSVLFLLLRLMAALQQRRLKRHALAVSKAQKAPAAATALPSMRLWFKFLDVLGSFQLSWLSKPWLAKKKQDLDFLPHGRRYSGASWWALKEVSSLSAAMAGLVMWNHWFGVVAMGAGGFFLPELWLKEKQRQRLARITAELPNVLDLLAACLEAGLGFDQALNVVLERGHQSHLMEELRELKRATAMGRARQDALKEMSARVDDADFRTFTSSLIQAEKMGIGITQTLKDQAVQLRNKYSQKIEKRALEAPVKILFPLIVFIFPIIFIILFGPIILRFIEGL